MSDCESEVEDDDSSEKEDEGRSVKVVLVSSRESDDDDVRSAVGVTGMQLTGSRSVTLASLLPYLCE